MAKNLSSQPGATRQRAYRQRIRQRLGVRPYTFYVTREEAAFIRKVFRKNFGHKATIGARREVVAAAAPAGGLEVRLNPAKPNQQMELL